MTRVYGSDAHNKRLRRKNSIFNFLLKKIRRKNLLGEPGVLRKGFKVGYGKQFGAFQQLSAWLQTAYCTERGITRETVAPIVKHAVENGQQIHAYAVTASGGRTLASSRRCARR